MAMGLLMTVSLRVYYWDNKNTGFGHVAVSCVEPEFYYLSWATGNQRMNDLEKHKKKPDSHRHSNQP